MAHVIEHLSNGEAVVAGLFEKLRPGGCFYIEYPGRRSTKLPSMYGTLNFYDDPSHVRLYGVKQLANLFEAIGLLYATSLFIFREKKLAIFLLPMRVLFSILALTMLFMSCMPCKDTPAFVKDNQPAAIAAAADHSHEGCADACSPLCICACCSVQYCPKLILEDVAYIANASQEHTSHYNGSPISVSLPVWQPPRI